MKSHIDKRRLYLLRREFCSIVVLIGSIFAVSACNGVGVPPARNLQALIWGTYLGGEGGEIARDVVIDTEGNIYVTGGTDSRSFPITAGALNLTASGKCTNCGTAPPMDVFIVKFSATGRLLWSALLGGPNYDRAYAIGLDADRNVYIAGRAGDEFPTTEHAIQAKFGGDATSTVQSYYGPQDPFVAKISADGTKLMWATYFGGADDQVVRDLAVDVSGDVYIALTHTVIDHPHITPRAFQTERRNEDAVVAKLSSDGTKVFYCTYLGGTGYDGETPSIAVDGQGHAYVLMGTASRDAPVTSGAYDVSFNGGSRDMLISKLSLDGRALVYSTYLGGAGYEGIETHGIAVDATNQAIVTFLTDSPDLPITENAFQSQHRKPSVNAAWDGYIARLSVDGSQLFAGTYLGGSAREDLEGIAVDNNGNIFVSGTTLSNNFPTTDSAFQRNFGGGMSDAFIAMLSPNLSQLIYGTFLGGSQFDGGRALALSQNGTVIVVGATTSPDFPTIHAYQPHMRGQGSAFIAAVSTTDRGSQ